MYVNMEVIGKTIMEPRFQYWAIYCYKISFLR